MSPTSQATASTAAARPDGSMVRVEGVSCIFDKVRAVDDASFELGRSKFLTILGPSGSGKTTLLRMIAGFIRPSSGEIFIAGQPVSAVPPHKRSIGMVFQRLALFPHMTAADNVAYPLKMRRFDPQTIPDRVETYLKLVRLPGYGKRRIHELSGGQQQRVAIARALVFEPDLLLLDEPLAALDRKLREDMQLEFRRIQQELGVTTINVTHDQREALVMSDEIIVMESGKIEQNARPVDTYRHPASRFVAGFIGVTNFLAAVVKEAAADGKVRLAVGSVELQARAPAVALAPGQSVDAALRAEQIRLAPEKSGLAGLSQSFDAIVEEVIFEGDRIVYGVRCAALGDTLLRLFDHDPLHHRSHAAGDAVFIGWNASDLMIFPR